MKKIFLALICLFALPAFCLAESNVMINEIAWMGTSESANAEWFELFNPTENEIDLTGWRLESADGSPKINLSGLIGAQSYYLMERTSDLTLPEITADLIYTGSLSNTGENLILYDSKGNIIDQINALDSWPGGENDSKKTLERSTNDSWQTSAEAGGTPRATNSNGQTGSENEPETENPTSTPETVPTNGNPAAFNIIQDIKKGDLIINEVFPNPIENPAENEFIEIKNVSKKTINLKNFVLKNSAKQSFTIYEIGLAPNAIAVFYRPQTNLAVNNSKEKITLHSDQNKIIDEITLKESEMSDCSWQKNLDKIADDDFCWEKPNPGQENICQSIVRPIVNLNGPESGEVFETLFFDAFDSFDKLGRKMKFVWEFGDGRIAYGPRARQIYINPGTYELKLKIIIDQIASSTEIKKIKIKDPKNSDSAKTESPTEKIEEKEKMIFQNADYLPNIFISEFLADPKDDEPVNEFIELFSNEIKPFDLGGFKLSDGAAKTKPFIFPQGTIIKPGQYLAFYRAQTKIALNNDGDTIKLLSPQDQIIDQVIYEKSKTDQSQVLDENFIWRTSQTPTPNEINILSQEPQTENSSTSPKILGVTNTEQTDKEKGKATMPKKSFGRYIFTGISGALATVVGIFYKFFKK